MIRITGKFSKINVVRHSLSRLTIIDQTFGIISHFCFKFKSFHKSETNVWINVNHEGILKATLEKFAWRKFTPIICGIVCLLLLPIVIWTTQVTVYNDWRWQIELIVTIFWFYFQNMNGTDSLNLNQEEQNNVDQVESKTMAHGLVPLHLINED